jgi:hypothetical protein
MNTILKTEVFYTVPMIYLAILTTPPGRGEYESSDPGT